jgi:hypothetical protein
MSSSSEIDLAEKQPLKSPPSRKAEVSKKIVEMSQAASAMKMTSVHDGLTTEEAAAAMEEFGANEVIAEEDSMFVKIMSRYLGLIPIMMLLVSILSASVTTTCEDGTEDVDGCACTESQDWLSFALLFSELHLM